MNPLMDVWNDVATSFEATPPLVAAARLFLAVVLGGLIGLEREANSRSAGLRTHILISMGACLFALLAYAFAAIIVGTTLPTPMYALYADRMHFDVLTPTVIYATYAFGVLFAAWQECGTALRVVSSGRTTVDGRSHDSESRATLADVALADGTRSVPATFFASA